MNYVIYIYDIIAISDKNLPRFTTEQETLLLNEKFIFNINPCTKRKESNLSLSTMTCIKTTRIITTNVVTQKMNKILK